MALRKWSKARGGIGRSSLAAIVVVVVVIAGAAVLVTQTSHPQVTATSTSYSTSTGSSSSLDKLDLSLTLNASTISSGQGITATVEDSNTLSAPLNVSASADWPIGSLALGPCGTLNYPVGIAVLQGDYNLSNVSSVSALEIFQPGVYACPMILSSIQSFLFQPSSDNATVYGSCEPGGACLTETAESAVAFSGYWSGGTFVPFPSGVYTVVAGDEWGDIAILHFVVAPGA